MKHQYVHLPLGQDMEFLAGYYTLTEEGRLPYDSREVLYVVGQAIVEASCCGSTSFRLINVPGYIAAWKSERDSKGAPVSEIEPIEATQERLAIRAILEEKYPQSHIDLW
jgi:hypothetical protein